MTITVSDSELTDSIDVTISVTNVNEAPSFATNTATRSIAENTASGEDIGAAVVATDPDSDDTLTYTLGGTDVDSFSIVNTSGQLRTNVALDHEIKASYSVTVTATDGDNLSDTTTVTISVTNVNEAPSFATARPRQPVPSQRTPQLTQISEIRSLRPMWMRIPRSPIRSVARMLSRSILTAPTGNCKPKPP